jgi:hypothetical protein
VKQDQASKCTRLFFSSFVYVLNHFFSFRRRKFQLHVGDLKRQTVKRYIRYIRKRGVKPSTSTVLLAEAESADETTSTKKTDNKKKEATKTIEIDEEPILFTTRSSDDEDDEALTPKMSNNNNSTNNDVVSLIASLQGTSLSDSTNSVSFADDGICPTTRIPVQEGSLVLPYLQKINLESPGKNGFFFINKGKIKVRSLKQGCCHILFLLSSRSILYVLGRRYKI